MKHFCTFPSLGVGTVLLVEAQVLAWELTRMMRILALALAWVLVLVELELELGLAYFLILWSN